MSVVHGPWIAFNGADARPWSVDWLLAIAKAVRGWLSVSVRRPRTDTVYDTKQFGAVNVAQLNFSVHLKNATTPATPKRRDTKTYRTVIRTTCHAVVRRDPPRCHAVIRRGPPPTTPSFDATHHAATPSLDAAHHAATSFDATHHAPPTTNASA